MEGKLHKFNARPIRCIPLRFRIWSLCSARLGLLTIFCTQGLLLHGARQPGKFSESGPDHDIDVVIPIPDTSRTAALELANELKVKYTEGFIKNRYIGRTFIMPGQQARKKSVRQKLNAIESEFEGKNVGCWSTIPSCGHHIPADRCRWLRMHAREKVHFASAAPPPCAIPTCMGLICLLQTNWFAHGRTEDEVRGDNRRRPVDIPGPG